MVHMADREYVKSEIDSLPDFVIERLMEFIVFQKFRMSLSEGDRLSTREMEAASMSSTSFWDNPDDEAWDLV